MPNHVNAVISMKLKKVKSRGHSFLGEEAGTILAQLLTARGDHGAATKLIEIAHRAQTAGPVLAKFLAAEATDVLSDYAFTPFVERINSFWICNWARKDSPSSKEIILVLELAELGLLHHMARCEKTDCGQWFFKKYPHQRFHDGTCQIAVLAADPQRKEKRKLKMRELRATKRRRKEIRKQSRKRGRK